MSYQLTDQEYAAIIEAPAEERFDYFVAKAVEGDAVWSLRSDAGWVAMSSEDGEECLPVWPHPDFAAEWATGDWADCKPAAIPLDTWLERWSSGLAKDKTLVAVFPNETEEGMVVEPGTLRQALEMELAGR